MKNFENLSKKIKRMIKNITYFIFPNKETRNLGGIYQLVLIFGLLLISFRFLTVYDFFEMTKNTLSFICLLILMISERIFNRRK